MTTSIKDPTSKLDELYPQWWIYPPRISTPYEHRARLDITELSTGDFRDVCKGRIPKENAAVLFFELYSFTTQDAATRSVRDEISAITGRVAWYPTVGGKNAFSLVTSYPDNNGYIGAPGVFGDKQDGYGESFIPQQYGRQLPLILSPQTEVGIHIQIIDQNAGDVIPQGERRFLSARLWGWKVRLPPGKIAEPYTRPPGYPTDPPMGRGSY
jgi:hypothetical protein